MAQSQAAMSSSSQTQEYPVRVPKDRRKRYNMLNMGSGQEPNFVELLNSGTQVRMERENNFKEYKTANDIDVMPKFGAGSEYGREQKEVARRKKFGIMLKKYNPEDQPWIMKIGSAKNQKKLKGVREGTIAENTSYYIFTQCADGGFDAFPVEEWYTFTPSIKYNYLNAEEAEEEFMKRDKQLNFFNIMLRKRILNTDEKDTEVDEEGKKSAKTKKKKSRAEKEFTLVEGDEFGEMSNEEDADEEEEEKPENDDEPKQKGAKKGKASKKKKNAKTNSDDEAIEESDEGDYDDREVDYMSDTSSSNSSMEVETRDKSEKYEEKGVDEELGLRNLIDSEEEEEEEEEKKNEESGIRDELKDKKPASDSSSSSSSSDSDSDIERDVRLPAALLIPSGSKPEVKPVEKAGGSKRKADQEDGSLAKKSRHENRMEHGVSHHHPSTSSSEGITEEAIRRYLSRKPMTIKDLLHKFKSKKLNITTEKMTHTIVHLLKKINPERKQINKKLYLSLRKPE